MALYDTAHMAKRLEDFRVVLCRPMDGRNVGAACRAMKNMGITSLYIVDAPGIDLAAAAVLAVHAEDVLEKTVSVGSLDAAVGDCGLVAGFTRRTGRFRKFVTYTAAELAAAAAERGPERVALVFGNEISGLSEAEIARCHVAAAIPSSPDCPSLNLAQAVQVAAYEIYRVFGSDTGAGGAAVVPDSRLEKVVDDVESTLDFLGFFRNAPPAYTRRLFRDIMARAGLSEWEADWLSRTFVKIRGHAIRLCREGRVR